VEEEYCSVVNIGYVIAVVWEDIWLLDSESLGDAGTEGEWETSEIEGILFAKREAILLTRYILIVKNHR
jgi:hypothetical protein